MRGVTYSQACTVPCENPPIVIITASSQLPLFRSRAQQPKQQHSEHRVLFGVKERGLFPPNLGPHVGAKAKDIARHELTGSDNVMLPQPQHLRRPEPRHSQTMLPFGCHLTCNEPSRARQHRKSMFRWVLDHQPLDHFLRKGQLSL